MTENIKQEWTLLIQYMIRLVRNPIEGIKNLPEVQWTTLIILQFCLSFVSVILSNIFAPFAISLVNVIISLFSSIIATGLVALFFYYFFLFLYNQKFAFIKVFTLVLFSHIPFAIFHLAGYFFPPADLIGLGLSALLMIVGLVENFSVPKKLATQLMMACYAIFFIYWAMDLVTATQYNSSSQPQTLDQMEKEVTDFFQ